MPHSQRVERSPVVMGLVLFCCTARDSTLVSIAQSRQGTTEQDTNDTSHGGPLGGMVWKVMTIGSTILATKAATTVASKGWKLVTGKSVPVKGDYDNERTRDVVAYTAVSAMLLAAAKVGLERKAAEYFRDSTGHLPKALVETKLTKKEKKAHKKLEKAQKKAEKQALKAPA